MFTSRWKQTCSVPHEEWIPAVSVSPSSAIFVRNVMLSETTLLWMMTPPQIWFWHKSLSAHCYNYTTLPFPTVDRTTQHFQQVIFLLQTFHPVLFFGFPYQANWTFRQDSDECHQWEAFTEVDMQPWPELSSGHHYIDLVQLLSYTPATGNLFLRITET